jgi:uncharacterized protein YbjT (DUF2867 family)
MRILAVGATGVIGRRLLPLLLHADHAVAGQTRTPEKADFIRLSDVGRWLKLPGDGGASFYATRHTPRLSAAGTASLAP